MNRSDVASRVHFSYVRVLIVSRTFITNFAPLYFHIFGIILLTGAMSNFYSVDLRKLKLIQLNFGKSKHEIINFAYTSRAMSLIQKWNNFLSWILRMLQTLRKHVDSIAVITKCIMNQFWSKFVARISYEIDGCICYHSFRHFTHCV
jgi:hypothetical protein